MDAQQREPACPPCGAADRSLEHGPESKTVFLYEPAAFHVHDDRFREGYVKMELSIDMRHVHNDADQITSRETVGKSLQILNSGFV